MSVKDNIAEEFDEFSKNYTNDMIALVPFYEKLMDAFTNCFPVNFQPKTILDVGCGNGNVTGRLMKFFPNAKYTLLDASSKMLELCQRQFANFNVSYVESYFKEYAFEENVFNLVVAGFSIHHCQKSEKRELIKRIYHSLKPNGIFSCADLMIQRPSPEHDQLMLDWKDFVLKTFPDGEKWNWLMEHYDEFDFSQQYRIA